MSDIPLATRLWHLANSIDGYLRQEDRELACEAVDRITELEAQLDGARTTVLTSRSSMNAALEENKGLLIAVRKLEAQLESMTANYNKSDIDLECENFKLKKQLAEQKEARKQDQLRINPQIENLLKEKGILEAQLAEGVKTVDALDRAWEMSKQRWHTAEAQLAELKTEYAKLWEIHRQSQAVIGENKDG